MIFDQEFIKYLLSMGVGGAIAALIFSAYRKQEKLYIDQIRGYIDLWKGQSDALITVVKENTASNTMISASNAAMMDLIRSLHRRLDVDSDERRHQQRLNGAQGDR